mmetsp:Transcript_10342/g.17040  ORF Transcript_10342/g.17040 Transcript_10342/m.17040 type:complete len:265 (+) Transcript_10342:1697-2491(+)
MCIFLHNLQHTLQLRHPGLHKMAILQHYPSSVLGERRHHCLGWLLLSLSHGDILEVTSLEVDAELLAQPLHPRRGVHTREQHKECGCLVGRLRVRRSHVKRLLFHEFTTHHIRNPVPEGGGHTIGSQGSEQNQTFERRKRLLVLARESSNFRLLRIKPLEPVIGVGLHVVSQAGEFLQSLQSLDLRPRRLLHPLVEGSHVARVLADLAANQVVHLLFRQLFIIHKNAQSHERGDSELVHLEQTSTNVVKHSCRDRRDEDFASRS